MSCLSKLGRAAVLPAISLVLAPAAFAQASPAEAESAGWVLRAAEVHVGDGTVHRPGMVLVRDGKIAAVGADLDVPANHRMVDLGERILTPGLIDAACQLGVHDLVGFSEQSSEVIPHLDTADAVDLASESLEVLAREGVTTIYATPEAASVIGSHGATLKTGGAGHSRFLEAPPSVKANVGPETWRRASFNRTPSGFRPGDFLVRRPTTRMGSVWEFRKAFYDAKGYAETGETDRDAEAMAVLADVLEGKIALRFQARKAHDIYTAERLTTEFGVDHVLEYGLEAYKALELLKQNQTAVIYGPLYVRPMGISDRGDDTQPCLTAPAQLEEHGIRFCLTAADLTGEQGLARQAGAAIRHGLPRPAALAAVTSGAAALLGLGNVGALKAGMDADLVAWSGVPFDATSGVTFVMIDGQIVHGAPPEEAEL